VTENLIIREAVSEDIDTIITLWKEFMEFHAARDPFFEIASGGDSNFKKFIIDKLSDESSFIFVARMEKVIAGYCLGYISEYPPVFRIKRFGMISDMAVNINYRRKGIGERLLEESKKWFTQKEIQRVELKVAISNEISTSFWRKMGFKPFVESMFMDI